jgi:hypothetical protein
MAKISGGCLCGAVRYESSAEPLGSAICHCTDCQHVSGSAFSVNVVVPASSVSFKGESLASFAHKGGSGKSLSRKFCQKCGSSIATEAECIARRIDHQGWYTRRQLMAKAEHASVDQLCTVLGSYRSGGESISEG